jgi:hypothetical protein
MVPICQSDDYCVDRQVLASLSVIADAQWCTSYTTWRTFRPVPLTLPAAEAGNFVEVIVLCQQYSRTLSMHFVSRLR